MLVQAQEAQTDAMSTLSKLSGRQGELRAAIQNGERALEETYDTSFEFARLKCLTCQLIASCTQLKLLKQGLAEIGNVNLNAIEEYAAVKERYDFLDATTN